MRKAVPGSQETLLKGRDMTDSTSHTNGFHPLSVESTNVPEGEIRKAIADLTKKIKRQPRSARVRADRGYMYGCIGQLDKAIADFNRAIKLDPELVCAHSYRGTVYSGKGEHCKALEDCTKAVELDPTCPEAHYYLGQAHSEKSEHGKAIEDYNKAIELDPTLVFAFLARGDAYFHIGDHEKGMEDYREAVRLDPPDATEGDTDTKKSKGIPVEPEFPPGYASWAHASTGSDGSMGQAPQRPLPAPTGMMPLPGSDLPGAAIPLGPYGPLPGPTEMMPLSGSDLPGEEPTVDA